MTDDPDLITVSAYRRENRGDSGRGVQNIVRVCTRLGIPVMKGPLTDPYMIPRSSLSILDAELDRTARDARLTEELTTPVGGLVYVVVLDPEARPGRVKVGCTNNMAVRLAQFTGICPDAQVHSTYRVGKECEGYALALASSIGTRLGATETFDFDQDQLTKYLSLLAQAFAPLRLVDEDEVDEDEVAIED